MSKTHFARAIALAVFAAGAGVASSSLQGATYYNADVLSFEMWCIDMQTYPQERCDQRRPDDVKEYDRYRASVETYERQRTDRARRDQEIKDRLSRGPGDRQP